MGTLPCSSRKSKATAEGNSSSVGSGGGSSKDNKNKKVSSASPTKTSNDNNSSGGIASNNSSSSSSKSKILVLRIVFIVSLVLAAVACGIVSYLAITNLEQSVGVSTYESVAVSALEGAKAITLRKLQSSDALASIVSYAFPNASQWPNVALDGYVDTASKLAAISSSTSIALIPLVRSSAASQWEKYAYQVYRDHGYPITAGNTSDFGFGIWGYSESSPYPDGRYHVTTGNKSYESDYDVLAPIFQHNIMGASSLMYDVKSNPDRGRGIDSIFDCANRHTEELELANTTTITYNDTHPTNPACAVVTDIVELIVRPGPAALLYGPIYPHNDPTTVVALTAASINWEEVLTNVVPNYVDGLVCVISTDDRSTQHTVSYVIHNGIPELVGMGDHHDSKFDMYAHNMTLNDMYTGASASFVYTLTVYPSEPMFDEFRTNSPLAIALGFVGVILFCTAIFFLYDFFMRNEAHQRRMILEVKRRFVRFVSHEIRTPLNTVCMGLELLMAEIEDIKNTSTRSSRIIKEHDNKNHIEEDSSGDDNKEATTLLNGEKKNEENIADNTDTGDGRGNNSNSRIVPVTAGALSNWLDLTGDIQENAFNAVAILNDLLNYDKIETGNFQLEFSTVYIWELVWKTVTAFSIQAKKSKVELNLALRPLDGGSKGDGGTTGNNIDVEQMKGHGLHLLNVVGDDMRLRQVLGNVLSNALKFSPDDLGVIDVIVRHDPNGLPGAQPRTKDPMAAEILQTYPRSGSISISVKDNGAGLTEDQLGQLFKEGVQFDANRLQSGGGSGLGLYITKGLVEQHGGIISVESDGPGQGSTFTVELPLYALPEDALDKPDNKSDAPTVVSTLSCANDRRFHRVLVVDDALTNRKMLIRLLERAGHSCSSATNGAEAIAAYCKDQDGAAGGYAAPFDTILMDYEMPVLNGPEATKQLREKGCKAFIVGVTGNVLKEDVDYFKLMGADHVLAKPVNVSQLDELWSKAKMFKRWRS